MTFFLSVCLSYFTRRAQNIFRQAMRCPVIVFHVVPAALKRQYEILTAHKEIASPQSNRVRFSQDSQHPGYRSSLVGGSSARSGSQSSSNHRWVFFQKTWMDRSKVNDLKYWRFSVATSARFQRALLRRAAGLPLYPPL